MPKERTWGTVVLKLDLLIYKLYTKANTNVFLYSAIVFLGFVICFPGDVLFLSIFAILVTILAGSLFFAMKMLRVAYLKLMES